MKSSKIAYSPRSRKNTSRPLSTAIAYYDVDAKKWTIAPGSFGIHVGDNVGDLILNGKVEIPESIAASTF